MVAATVAWGLSGLYFKALVQVPPLEMLSHRTLWSVLFLGAVLLRSGGAASWRGRSAGRGWSGRWRCRPG